jgi:23S rRNA (uracil1939-C5)-methyltransferase
VTEESHVVEIDDLTSEGSGVGRLPDGRAVFVPRTVPGERVVVRLVREKKRWAKGEALEILAESPDRREPRCPLHDRCGGCQLQHIDYAAQVEWKARRIRETLSRIGGVDPGPVEVAPARPAFGYRNRVSFTLKRLRGGRVVAGFHDRERPAHIVDVRGECFLPERGILPVWMALRAAWGDSAHRLPPGRELRLTLRRVDEGVILVIEGGQTGNHDVPEAEGLVEEIEEMLAVWHHPDGAPRPLLLAGARTVDDAWFGETLELESSAFLQVNRAGAETVHAHVMSEVGEPEGRRFVDAYAGVGAYGRRLAREGGRVVAIESEASAARVARRTAPEGLRVIEGRVEDHLAAHLPADVVVLNPPRAGVSEAVSDTLVAHPVARVVYVSCDPATLARDLQRLGPGYGIARVRGFDLFPQTAHVETVVTLDARAHNDA